MKLYFSPGACSFVPHTLLETAGAPFEPIMVKLHKGENYSPEYKAINPRSQVPVLVDGDQVITQIAAIVNHLNRPKFPQLQRFHLPRDSAGAGEDPDVRDAGLDEQHGPSDLHPHLPAPQVCRESEAAKAELKAFNSQAVSRA